MSKTARAIRLETRLTHRKDREVYERLRAHPDFESLGEAELLRVAIRRLDVEDAFSDAVAGIERRLGGSMRVLHKSVRELDTQNQMLMAFFEVFMRTYYFHTLPVPIEARRTAAAEADRRSRKFIEDVASLLQKGGAGQQIVIQLHAAAESE